MNKSVISIAPFDTTGITGLAGDLKTFQMWKCYGAGVATEVVAANSLGIQALHPVPFEFIAQQLESITSDIEVHGVKVGTLRTPDAVKMIASLIEAYNFRTLVLEPGLRTKAGVEIVPHDVVPAIRELLFPRATILVINASEAALLSGLPVGDVTSMRDAALAIAKTGPLAVVVTGGHLDPRVIDVVADGTKTSSVDGPRIASNNTLGLGTVFSAALLSQVVKGIHTPEAVSAAKKFVAKAMTHPFQIGKGHGPLNLNVPV